MGIKEGEKREGEQDAGRFGAASGAQRVWRAWPPACRKIQRWGPNLRFPTPLSLCETVFFPAAALWRGLSMLAVQYNGCFFARH
jgi:hypothetical protein